jgi:hypothetical protein
MILSRVTLDLPGRSPKQPHPSPPTYPAPISSLHVGQSMCALVAGFLCSVVILVGFSPGCGTRCAARQLLGRHGSIPSSFAHVHAWSLSPCQLGVARTPPARSPFCFCALLSCGTPPSRGGCSRRCRLVQHLASLAAWLAGVHRSLPNLLWVESRTCYPGALYSMPASGPVLHAT